MVKRQNGTHVDEDLTEVLNAQDQRIAELEEALENKTAGGGEPNIFVQTTEPEVKKGIWLKYNGEIEHIYGDDDVVESESWYPDGTFRNIPYSFNDSASTVFGTDIYLFGGYNGVNYLSSAYKYDTLTNTYTQLANIPDNRHCQCPAVSVNTDIYLLGSIDENASTNNYKYDTTTNTYIQLTNIPYKFIRGAAASVETDIYLFGSCFYVAGGQYPNSQYTYKYNTLTDTYTKMANIPNRFWDGVTVKVGTNIYLFGGYDNSGNFRPYVNKYDTINNTYITLSNSPQRFKGAVAFGTTIYLFGETYCYKYDTLTNTYTQLANIPYSFNNNNNAVLICNKAFLLGGSSYPTKVQCMQIESKEYEDNSVVISQGRLYNVGYATELFSNNLMQEPALYALADAWFYTTEDGLITNIPSYYGDGIQWINFKNPPSDVTNDESENQEI